MVSLGGEQVRWTQQLAATTEGMKNTLAKALFSAASLVYAGAFNAEYRATISQFLMERLRSYGFVIEQSPGQIGEFKLTDILADQVTLMDYINRFKLPSDAHSQQNAVMLFNSQKYCLLIDPEGQGQQFVKNFYKEQGIEVCKVTDSELQRTLQNCFRFGKKLLITGFENDIDPSLNSIIEQKYEHENKTTGPLGLFFDGNFIPYNPGFKLILSSHLNNPNYQPEQFVKLTVLNFAITLGGLQDQLLGHLFIREQREQEEQKNQLVVENSKARVQLKQLEQQVLTLLGNNDSDILSNEPLIETLSLSQRTSKEIQE